MRLPDQCDNFSPGRPICGFESWSLEKVRVAKALADLPVMDAALAAGAVSYSKVRALTRIATPATEQKLLYMASQATAAQLEAICRGVAQVATTTKDGASRFVWTRTGSDGMILIETRLRGWRRISAAWRWPRGRSQAR
ncbi:MAG: hypothetical protein IT385_16955 [Deltaproteobacteria bacterium]|nr:hypothetical protein [Deltaproteobacteria bacterium]